SNLGWKVKDFRGMTFEEVEAKFNSVWKQMEDFIPMGSKEEAERIIRKGLNLEQESAKKQKTSEEVPEEAMSPKEVLEEKGRLESTIEIGERDTQQQTTYKSNLGWKVKDFRGMTFEEVEAKFNSVWKQMEDFIPMGSKEEAERIIRKGLNLEQESAKKQKTSEEVPEEAMSP
nr:hypothetical protein [Tanacetum cinerariifolium]